MGRQILKVTPGFQHPTNRKGSPIPGAHAELLSEVPPEEKTCLQIYETVSEGTPVSPVFSSVEDLRRWLVGCGVPDAVADNFLETDDSPTFMIAGNGKLQSGIAQFVPQAMSRPWWKFWG